MLSVVRSVRNIAHRIIEEFMLAANEAVAEYLEKRGIGSLHRVHEKPDPKKVLEFEEMAQAFGYSLGVEDLAERRIAVRHGDSGRPRAPEEAPGARPGPHAADDRRVPGSEEVNIRPQHYQRLTEKIAGKPEERILSYLMLRSLKQARYAADPLGHFALAAQEYTHFTSPIRRYPDLIVHRALKWALENPDAQARRRWPRARESAQGRKEEPAADASARTGEWSFRRSPPKAPRRSAAPRCAERELMDWKTAQFMESHLGEEYDALIISVQKFGFFVELMEIFVEGLVSIDRLEEIRGTAMRLSGARSRDCRRAASPFARGLPELIFRIGDRMRVRAERIDPFRHRVEFAPVMLEVPVSAVKIRERG